MRLTAVMSIRRQRQKRWTLLHKLFEFRVKTDGNICHWKCRKIQSSYHRCTPTSRFWKIFRPPLLGPGLRLAPDLLTLLASLRTDHFRFPPPPHKIAPHLFIAFLLTDSPKILVPCALPPPPNLVDEYGGLCTYGSYTCLMRIQPQQTWLLQKLFSWPC